MRFIAAVAALLLFVTAPVPAQTFTVPVEYFKLANGIYGTVPFLMLFQVGFLYTGMLSLLQQYGPESVEVVQGKEA